MSEKAMRIVASLLTLVCVIIMFACVGRQEKEYKATAAELMEQIADLRDENGLLNKQLDEREALIQTQADVIDELRRTRKQERQEEKTNRGGDRLTSLGIMDATAYCSCEKCCGEYAKNRPDGKVYGAAGVELTPGISVAGWLPLGTQIMIDGHEYIVQDRTAKWVKEKYDGRIIDIYFDDHEAALEWGRQKKEIFEVAK